MSETNTFIFGAAGSEPWLGFATETYVRQAFVKEQRDCGIKARL